jgi:hypothetical protein
MNRVVLDAEQRAKLNRDKGGVEFTDENGNVLGYLMTQDSFDWIAIAILPPPTKEELAEARKEMLEKGGVSTEELLASLERINREWDARQ